MKIMFKKDVGEKILKAGYSHAQMACEIDQSRQSISGQIKREFGITPNRAKKLCVILDEDFDSLFTIVERKRNSVES